MVYLALGFNPVMETANPGNIRLCCVSQDGLCVCVCVCVDIPACTVNYHLCPSAVEVLPEVPVIQCNLHCRMLAANFTPNTWHDCSCVLLRLLVRVAGGRAGDCKLLSIAVVDVHW